jgi:SH3 domain protein
MCNGLLKTLVLLLLCQGAYAAETLYVHDQLRLGVRAAPDSSESSIAVVSTGDALTVLGEQGGFIHIRTERGVEGWVSKGYLSAELPARSQLEILQKEHQALQQEQGLLQRQLEESRQLSEQQASQLQRLEHDKVALQQQLARYATVNPGFFEKYKWLLQLGLLLACFFAGLITGVRRKARQVAERIGGLEI